MTSAITHTLFHFLWEGALIAILLIAALHLGRPTSARVRYALACAAMLTMLASFGVTLAWFWPHSQPVVAHSSAATPIVAAFPDLLPYEPPIAATPPRHPMSWVAALYILGVVLFSLRSFAAWLAAMRLRRTGVAAASALWQARFLPLLDRARVSRPVILLESYLTDIPVVIGFLKPVILVPASLFTGFPPDQLEFILLHELAHIRRHDYLVNLLQSLAEDLLFYHPAVWWVSAVIRTEREHCCDDAVVAAQGDPHGFAEALAALEQQRWSAYDAAVAANGGHLMNRIRRLLNAGPDRPRFTASPAFSAGLLVVVAVLAVQFIHAQPAPAPQAPAPAPAPSVAPVPAAAPEPVAQTKPETIAEPKSIPAAKTEDQKKQDEERLKRELQTPYKKWLNEDVYWIITQDERTAFRNLTTDEGRQQFIEQFWLKRDPTPATPENEYREEYYRRIAYAIDTFSSDRVPGWKTDRGMIYIKYGPPDEREEHPSGGTAETYPYEKWRYRYLPGVGNDVLIEFDDETGKGEYHMTADPAVKDKLLYVPAEGLALAEQLGAQPLPANVDQFTRLQQFANLPKPTPPAFPPADAIEDVVFNGARRTPQDFLLNLIPTRAGDKLDQSALDKDASLLRNTQRFDNVQVGYARGKTGWIVTFTVAEKQVQRPADAQTAVPKNCVLDAFKNFLVCDAAPH